MFSALLLAGVLSALALAAGVAVGARLSQRLVRRRQQASTEWTGITVAQMLQRIVALMPMGVAVVDSHRDVVYLNDRAKELGLVRDRQLDDQAWEAAQQALRAATSSSICHLESVRAAGPGYRCTGKPGCSARKTGASPWSSLTTSLTMPAWRQPDVISWPTSATNSRPRSVRWPCSPRPCWHLPMTPTRFGGSPRRC
ncbi:signal-transduction histidine kinase senX3 domain protein [Mycobacterium ulcerans str. Harvey]|uniref:Signal-transduction histidine kinase senX3 domain protein n=1 Tax=Mycobacterium ulcerans str. Harvey TaxID=1299332 RepID=A0ABN0QNA0_MYCUL|nr:signal-transduction histidine kinase senX3 domain protein [Mycobacterium ulcerans str. Harvey]